MAGETERGMGELQIGRVLKEARTRAGLDVRTVEERTKIRVKYLRALEDEDWDVLPSPAYAKGFMRTYAQLLGLDGEALVDEFRRQVETGRDEPTYPLAEQVLERRRRPGEPPGARPSGPRNLLIGAGVVVVGVLLVLGITGGDDDEGSGRKATQREAREERRREERRQERRRERREQAAVQAEADQVELELAINADVTVCLLGGEGNELIDGQVLAAGTEERFSAKRFELRFPFGYDRGFFELRLDGERQRVPETQGATAFRITPPGRLQRAPEPGPECP